MIRAIKILALIICGITQLSFLDDLYSQEQLYKYELSKVPQTNTSRIFWHYEAGLNSTESNVFINRIKINTQVENIIEVEGIEDEESYKIEFQVEEKNSSFQLGFAEGPNNDLFAFQLVGPGLSFNIIAPGYNSDNYSYDGTTNFKIVRCASSITFLADNSILISIPITSMTQDSKVYLNPSFVPGTEIVMLLNPLENCSEEEPSIYLAGIQNYSVVKANIPKSESIIYNNRVKFFYLEKYAIVEGINDKISVNIYNRLNKKMNGEPIFLDNITGSNYQEIDLTDFLEGNFAIENWLLEVTNANKEQTYYLRITQN